jgi:K+-sensing histidine kinase KdpD
VPPLLFDPRRIAVVLVNLIANAQRQAAPGPVELTIEPQGAEVEVAVSAGMDAQARERSDSMVEMFFASSGLSDASEHVGLDICRALIEAHGGRFWIECARGQTRFRFALPLAVS